MPSPFELRKISHMAKNATLEKFPQLFCMFYHTMHYSAKHSLAIASHLSVHLSVTLVDHDHIGWKSWKLIAWTISQTSSLFVAQRSFTYSQGNMEKLWGENVHSTPTSIKSGWIESTESHVILGGGEAVCLLLSVHCAVIFAIAQLSCYIISIRKQHNSIALNIMKSPLSPVIHWCVYLFNIYNMLLKSGAF